MKRQAIKALPDKSVAELNKLLVEMSVELAQKRHQKRVGKIQNPRAISVLADDIARVKTVLRLKELTADQASVA